METVRFYTEYFFVTNISLIPCTQGKIVIQQNLFLQGAFFIPLSRTKLQLSRKTNKIHSNCGHESFHTISVIPFYEMVYERRSIRMNSMVWAQLLALFAIHWVLLWSSVSFQVSILLQDSWCYGKRSSYSFCFTYSARSRHSSADLPHRHVHLIQSAAITINIECPNWTLEVLEKQEEISIGKIFKLA